MTTLESWRIIVENEHNDVQKILDDWENEQQAALLTEKELDGKIADLVIALGKIANPPITPPSDKADRSVDIAEQALAQAGKD